MMTYSSIKDKSMKKYFQIILIALTVLVCGMTASAQTTSGQRLSREELAVRQANYIARELALDGTTTQKYVDAYCQYQRELWNLGPRRGLTTEQRLERSQQILDLRKKYNAIYRGFLSEQQLEKAYKIEKRLIDRMGGHKGPKHHHRNQQKRLTGNIS